MNWITRERPKIDRKACPWLIRRFINPDAQIFFTPFGQGRIKALELDDIPDTNLHNMKIGALLIIFWKNTKFKILH